MEVHKTPLLSIFDSKQRLEVPLFQRQYVWNEEHQWFPLWEDIERKFIEALEGRTGAPHHFLGAMVLDQKQTPTGHVIVRQVIDGQQRLTTFQIFLAALRDFCRDHECTALADECDKFVFNTGMMANRDVDKFKVWPTQFDRPQFRDVLEAGSFAELHKRHPVQKKKFKRKPEPLPLMVQAYFFFYEQLRLFFLGDEGEEPLAASSTLSERLEECFQTLRSALMVVVIDLQADDDPQVIFETLNARGEPLLPADLLRNYIFLRAGRAGLDTEKTYQQYWAGFDDEFWRTEVKQGRLTRPRSDLFMQHFLASRQGNDIPIKHLFVEYKHWVEAEKPFKSITEELGVLARQRDDFRRILEPAPTDVIHDLCVFLEAFDIRTAYPLLLALARIQISDAEWREVAEILESYLLRRAICNLGTKNYNRIFLDLAKSIKDVPFSADTIRQTLQTKTGDSTLWPEDATFREAWVNKPLYGPLNSPKLVHIYTRLNHTFMSSKAEQLVFMQTPSVEHILPQQWRDNWRLADGSEGLDEAALQEAADDDAAALATRQRNAAVQTLGNMTILSTALNTAQSNLGWAEKRAALAAHSLLPINQAVQSAPIWNEDCIKRRGEELFTRAVKIWPRS